MTKENVGDMFKWLKEGSECEVVIWNGRVLAVELPSSVVLKVTDTDPGVRGDTAQGQFCFTYLFPSFPSFCFLLLKQMDSL